jgi:transcriptional regulator with XRE-family HTH domain
MKYRTVKIVDAQSLNQEVGQRIRQVREKRGLQQAQLGAHLGLTRAAVSNMELGRHAIMLVHIYNIALFLGVPVRKLLPE